MKRRTLLLSTAVMFCALASGTMARSQDYPARSVKLIIPSGAGSGPDVIARIVADKLSATWGQQIVVENRPGASGAIAVRDAGSSAPDGYTLYFGIASNFVTLPLLQPKLQYNVGRDFVPIGFIAEQPMIIAVPAELGVENLSELIALAKKQPGQLNCAVLSPLTMPDLAAELVEMASATNLTLVHYPSTPKGLTDLIGGRVQVIIDGLSGLSGAIASRSIKPLAVMSGQRLPNFPDLPTAAEVVPGVQATGWFALMGPPGTPAAIASKVNNDLRAILARSDLRQRFEQLGTYVRPMSLTELGTFIGQEQRLWRPVLARVRAETSN